MYCINRHVCLEDTSSKPYEIVLEGAPSKPYEIVVWRMDPPNHTIIIFPPVSHHLAIFHQYKDTQSKEPPVI